MWDSLVTVCASGWDYIFESKIVGTTVAIILVVFNLLGLITNGSNIFITLIISFFVMCPVTFILGFIYNIKTYSQRKEIDYYYKMFEDIKLISMSGEYPIYHGTQENEYLKAIGFKTLIPVEVWQSKKTLLETYLNT